MCFVAKSEQMIHVDLSTQNHSSQQSNNKGEYEEVRAVIRKMIDVWLGGSIDNVPDDQVDVMLKSCVKGGFVEELRLVISLLKSPVEYIAYTCVEMW